MRNKAAQARREVADVTSQIAALSDMTLEELRDRFHQVYGEPTTARHKGYLRKKVAWQIQALVEGGLSQRALNRIEELAPLSPQWRKLNGWDAQDGTPRRDPRLPAPGSVIIRTHDGVEHMVTVLEDSFLYEGEYFRSLSRVARAITGTNWNGFLFFHLKTNGRR